MCDISSDPSMHERTCEKWLWREGMDVLCQRNGAQEWRDRFGADHAACPSHIEDMKRRWPEAERVTV